MTCSLCGYEFDRDVLSCHAGCPLAEGCHIICCPNCGYQMVDETRSGTLKLFQGLKERVTGWASEQANG